MSQLRKTIIICLFLIYTCTDTESAVLIADFSMTRMIELFAKRPYCKLHTDRGDIQRMLLHADPKKARQVSRENLLALEEVCLEAGGLSGELQGGLGFIYPGTKWCGPGNIASEYSELGRYADEDRCCREHDLCPHTLSPGECKRGLCNSQTFTRSHCDCDARFRRCLQGLNTETANTLGAVFFNVVQVTCFKERRPCSVYQSYQNICPWEYEPSDLYTSAPILNLENEIFPNLFPPQYRSFNDVRRYGQVGLYNPEAKIRIASLGLIAKSLFKDLVIRQVGGLFQLYSRAKNILDDR